MNFVQWGIPFSTYNNAGEFSYHSELINGTIGEDEIFLQIKKGAVLGIEFYSYGFSALTGLKACDFTNKQFYTYDILGNKFSFIHEKIRNANHLQDKISLLENWLEKFVVAGINRYPLLEEAIHLIERYKGAILVKDICSATKLGERTLEKKFNNWVGISPKQYITFKKISSFLNYCLNNGHQPWNLHIDSRAFYDQAHFNKTFKKVTGLPPGEYLNKVNNTLDFHFVGR